MRVCWFLPLVSASIEVLLDAVPSPLEHHTPQSHGMQALAYESPLANFRNLQYSGKLYIGTPPRPFQLIFDTGSSWTWVNDVKCGNFCNSAPAFDPAQSSSYVANGTEIPLFYGSGNGRAVLGSDSIALLPNGSASVMNQPMLLMQESQGFQGMQGSGILGLGFHQLSDGFPTFVENLKEQGVVDRAEFGMFISDNKFREKDTSRLKSCITFGGHSLSKYAHPSTPVYLPAYYFTGFWTARLDSVRFGSRELLPSAQAAIIDSGTSLLIAPGAQVRAVTAAICSKHYCTHEDPVVFYCDSIPDDMPDITFTMEGEEFVLTPKMYVWVTDMHCVVLLGELPGLESWILGDVFMRAFYTIFDMEHSRLGFAPSINYPPPSSAFLFWLLIGIVVVLMAGAIAIWIFKRRDKILPMKQPLL